MKNLYEDSCASPHTTNSPQTVGVRNTIRPPNAGNTSPHTRKRMCQGFDDKQSTCMLFCNILKQCSRCVQYISRSVGLMIKA